MNPFENRVLFIDGEALVIDKPAGLAVHPGTRTPASLEDYLHHLRFGFQRLPQPVHRLDRDTSGCLLLARNPKALRRFQQAFEARVVDKTYVAILDGVPEAEEGRIDLPLAKVSSAEAGWRMVADAAGKPAVTHWRLLEVRDGRAMILFSPETGRTHQLRIHAVAGLGHAISGDPVYGAGKGPMLLHALSLRLDRGARAPVEARAPLPPSFAHAGFADALDPDDEADDLPRERHWRDRLDEATTFTFLAASGPGGQNVNKVATACQLRCDTHRLGLTPDVYRRLKAEAGSRMTGSGTIVITARTHRTQEANRAEARERLEALLEKAHIRPVRRVKTKPSRSAKAKRMEGKKVRSAVKQGRGKVSFD